MFLEVSRSHFIIVELGYATMLFLDQANQAFLGKEVFVRCDNECELLILSHYSTISVTREVIFLVNDAGRIDYRVDCGKYKGNKLESEDKFLFCDWKCRGLV